MPNFKKNKSAFMMKGKSSMMKKLVGKQKNIDKNKDGKISEVDIDMMNSPINMYGKKESMAKKYKSDAQRKAVHASKAEKGSMAKNYKKGYYGA